MSEYRHGLNADMRRVYAMRTADKVGGAFSGWAPKQPKARSSWWLVAACALLLLAAWRLGL